MTNSGITAFLTVIKEGSISKAADKLFVSQSSLSTRIKTLEKELGYPVFMRGKGLRKIELTELGEKFYDLAVQYNEIVSQMTALSKSNIQKKLRVSLIDSVGAYLIPDLFSDYMKLMPNVALEVQESASKVSYKNLENGITDLAFTAEQDPPKNIVCFPIFAESILFVASKGLKFSKTVSLDDLDTNSEIYFPWTHEFESWHNVAFHNKPQAKVNVDSVTQQIFFLKNGSYWSFAPASIAKSMEKAGSANIYPLDVSLPKRITKCAYVKEPDKQLLIKNFIISLQESLHNFSDPDMEIYI